MKKSTAQTIMETLLIGALVAIVTIVAWKLFANSSLNLARLTTTTAKTTKETPPSEPLNVLFDNLKSKLSEFEKDRTNLSKRVETAGALGQLLAQCKSTSPMCSGSTYDLLIEAIQKMASPKTADTKACISNPQSCTALMTITDFSWSAGNSEKSLNMSSTYSGGKIPVTLNYTNTYVGANGQLVTETINQLSYVQKEQNADSVGKTYDSFLNTYMDSKFDKSSFTGSGAQVQSNIDAYLSGKNCELSKSDSKYVDFANHKIY